MNYEDEADYRRIPEGYTPDEDIVSSACENHWDEIQEAVEEVRGSNWLSDSATCLDLLSTVSQRDFTHLRGGLKKYLRKGQSDGDELTDEQLFAIASDLAALVERLPDSVASNGFLSHSGGGKFQLAQEPTPSRCIAMAAGGCNLGDDLSWAKDLLAVTKAFRDILSALSDPDLQEPYLRLRIKEPLQCLNYFIARAPALLLVNWPFGVRPLSFGRCPDPEVSDLPAYLADWISEYLKSYYPRVGIGVCAECGKFFERERRDKTFCSKTCQNRVAYKRKRILGSDALELVNIAADEAVEIVAGLWIHHPRFGIGLIQGVSANRRPFGNMVEGVPDKQNARYRSMIARSVIIQVQFLHGIRMLTFTDLFEAQKREEQLPDFYQVKSEETLAELL